MDSVPSDARTSRQEADADALGAQADNGLKIVVVGGFGVGKTTLVRSVSQMPPSTPRRR